MAGYTIDLFILVIVESFINIYFFREATEDGFFGAIIISFAISLINVAGFFIVGYSSKLMHSIYSASKIISIILVLLVSAFMAFSHLVVGHYRGIYLVANEQDEFVDMTVAINQAIQRSINFEIFPDFNSFLLIIIGVLLGIYAVIKGYNLGDRYPGYSNKRHRVLEAQRTFDRKIARIAKKVKKSQQAIYSSIESYSGSVGSKAAIVTSSGTELANAENLYQNFVNSVSNAYETAIHEYNRQCRGAARLQIDQLNRTADAFEFNDDVRRTVTSAQKADEIAAAGKERAKACKDAFEGRLEGLSKIVSARRNEDVNNNDGGS